MIYCGNHTQQNGCQKNITDKKIELVKYVLNLKEKKKFQIIECIRIAIGSEMIKIKLLFLRLKVDI